MVTRVLFVRHGETTWNREGRVQGWAQTSLTGRGRDQARATGVYLRTLGIDRVLASDLRRAQETARLAGEGTGSAGASGSGGGPGGRDNRPGAGDEPGVDATLSFDRAWRERDFGDYQGLGKETIAERHDEYDLGGSLSAVESVPGGESLDEFRRRVVAGWESLLAGVEGETVVVVTHGGPLRAVFAEISGRDVPTVAREWAPDNCGITEVDVSGDPNVVRRDDTSHLE
jgi:probable phosphoglycerate mutase